MREADWQTANFDARLFLGDCREVLAAIPDESVDSIVCDPPYGLEFMGKKWDYDVPSVAQWAACLRVLKPGGHLLSFAGTRTMHRMAVNIEDRGFEIRDTIAWVYGSGFPKSLDVSKAIDKAAGAEREITGTAYAGIGRRCRSGGEIVGGTSTEDEKFIPITTPSTDAAKQWAGWGTALKPAFEPITVARKPLIGTVAENVQKHGAGAINIDGCRISFLGESDKATAKPGGKATARSGSLAGKTQDGFVIAGPADDGETLYWSNELGWCSRDCATVFDDDTVFNPNGATGREPFTNRAEFVATQGSGRWPANLIHDGSEEVVELFPKAGGEDKRGQCNGKRPSGFGNVGHESGDDEPNARVYADSGSAARFFYCAKASKSDRSNGNNHPTVKPTELMRYLCRLVTPPNGVVLDPWMGSGSTGKAAILEGFRFIGIERDASYFDIATKRIEQEANREKYAELFTN